MPIDGSATLTIETSSTVMKKAAQTTRERLPAARIGDGYGVGGYCGHGLLLGRVSPRT